MGGWAGRAALVLDRAAPMPRKSSTGGPAHHHLVEAYRYARLSSNSVDGSSAGPTSDPWPGADRLLQ